MRAAELHRCPQPRTTGYPGLGCHLAEGRCDYLRATSCHQVGPRQTGGPAGPLTIPHWPRGGAPAPGATRPAQRAGGLLWTCPHPNAAGPPGPGCGQESWPGHWTEADSVWWGQSLEEGEVLAGAQAGREDGLAPRSRRFQGWPCTPRGRPDQCTRRGSMGVPGGTGSRVMDTGPGTQEASGGW